MYKRKTEEGLEESDRKLAAERRTWTEVMAVPEKEKKPTAFLRRHPKKSINREMTD
jgi:hypothetical protein